MTESKSTLPMRRRSSAFTETGLEGHDFIVDSKIHGPRPRLSVRFRSNVSIVEPGTDQALPTPSIHADDLPTALTFVRQQSSPFHVSFVQIALFLVLVAVAFPLFNGQSSKSHLMPIVAEASPMAPNLRMYNTLPVKRQDSSSDVCKRWSGQSAIVNGTVYYYGGRTTTSSDQTDNQWNNNFLSLDLTKSWQIGSPSLNGLLRPSGPPAVSLGALWASTDHLFLYGGQFSDAPVESPAPNSLWSYKIASGVWTEHKNPEFIDGTAVQRAAEGAGVSIPGQGLGYYFGGHLDGYTTEGWSQSTPRVYLPSMIEFTMPGFSNSEVKSASPAGQDGVYRNITVGNAGFPERADGSLIYVPGYSNKGIIVDLAGGTNQSFTQLNVIDIYDISTSTWYKQATEGSTPGVRVNPCAVAASAADGSSTQIHMYGGQNLIPYGSQTQYDDMWILTIPSFTWIKVDTDGQSAPPARAGHMCHHWNSQMVVIGGYVGQELSCDSPGIYVFNTSSLSWQTSYVSLTGGDNLNRQKAQKEDPNALQGSYGYQVPAVVQSVIGGNAEGGATVTAPVQTPSSGPLATGRPELYTVTGSDGSVTTQTGNPGSGGRVSSSGGSSGPNVGAIVAGTVAGVLFLIALYLAFCTYVYRKQVKLYKNHAAMLQHENLTNGGAGAAGFYVARPKRSGGLSEKTSERVSSDNRSTHSGVPGSSTGNSGGRNNEAMEHYPYDNVMALKQSATANSSTEDLMRGQEPSFLGVLLAPRRSLRVVNKD